MPPRDAKLHRSFTEALRNSWRAQARPEQVAPPGNWATWVFKGGRGAGKTRSGAEFVQERVAAGARFIHLIAPTAADCRDVMLEGPAGILSIAPSHMRPIYQPSLRKLVWPSGAQGLLFSSDEPDRLRGPQCDTAWIDELCAMRTAQEVLDNMYFGLRVGKDPRCLITTTPRPIKCFRALLARDGQDVVVTSSSSFANRENLAAAFFSQITAKYAGTRLGRQELEAELLTDTPGALWHLDRIEELRVRVAPQPFERVLVAIDPAVTHGPDSDETGIVVVGLGADGGGYVLDDLSGRYPPEEWARRAIHAYRTHAADRIVGEVNNGGALVEHTLRSVDPGIPFTAVHASRGKLTRAEPVSALYEQGKVHHVGVFGPLEDQLTSYDGSRDGSSPDRLDALVWGLTALMLGDPPGRFIRTDALLERAEVPDGDAPVDVPHQVESVFAVGAISETEPDALGVVHFAVTGDSPALVVLDWDVMILEQETLDGFFSATAARLEELVRLTGSRSAFAPLLVENVGLGAMLGEQGRLRRFRVMPLEDEELLAKPLPTRLIETGNYLHSGALKLSREAFDKRAAFRGVLRNHLCSELGAFSLTDNKPRIGPLAAAFATGALHSFGGRQWLDVWRGCLTPLEPGPLGAARKSVPPPPPAPVRRPDADVLGPNHPAAIRAAKLRAENEARVERENERLRAAARVRDALMAAEESP
jgi:predicted phage terminase large subunit-like protein